MAIARIGVLNKLEEILKFQGNVDERALQELLEGAPWFINPQWTILQANQTFESLRSAFERWYHNKYGMEVITTSYRKNKKKRPDFVVLHIGRKVEIVEIKRPGHSLGNKEFERVREYIERLQQFLNDNPTFKLDFPNIHATLICDKLNLSPTPKLAFDKLSGDGLLEKKTWEELLRDAKKVLEDFLKVYGPSGTTV